MADRPFGYLRKYIIPITKETPQIIVPNIER